MGGRALIQGGTWTLLARKPAPCRGLPWRLNSFGERPRNFIPCLPAGGAVCTPALRVTSLSMRQLHDAISKIYASRHTSSLMDTD
eukprot:365535-Chlamydomonas_euryale.AAC.13